jgi:hypothetical protein
VAEQIGLNVEQVASRIGVPENTKARHQNVL